MTPSFVERCHRHAPAPGLNPTAIDGLSVFRVDRPTPPIPAVYDRAIVLVAAGRKRSIVGRERYVYDPEHYLVASVPLPVVSEVVEASPKRPFLALTVHLDLALALELFRQIPETMRGHPPGPPERGMAAAEVTPLLHEAAYRLVRLLDHPEDIPALAPLVQRELVYHVLRGPQGAYIRALAFGSARHRAIDDVLESIHADCTRPIAVPELARRARMSESTFYEAFRTVTGSAPLQYVKRLRLLEAHRRIAHRLDNVAGAAAWVGYTSLSQFSREFTRMFGENPSRVVPSEGATRGSVRAVR